MKYVKIHDISRCHGITFCITFIHASAVCRADSQAVWVGSLVPFSKAINSALADSKAARASPWRSPSCSRNVFGKKPSNTVYTAVLFEKPAGSLGCSPCCLAFASQQLCNRHVCDSPLSKTVKIPCLDVAKLAQRSTRHWLVRLERLPYISQHLSIRVVIQSLTPVITVSIINPGEKSNLSQHIRNLSISTKDTISAKACARSAICAALRGLRVRTSLAFSSQVAASSTSWSFSAWV